MGGILKYRETESDPWTIVGTAGMTATNRNLLDNWYFKNPVNQKGQTEYTTGGPSVDRWILVDGKKITLSKDGLTTDVGIDCWQQFENPSQYFGKTITISAMIDNELVSATCVVPDGFQEGTVVSGRADSEGGNILFVINASAVWCTLNVYAGHTIQAAKAEFGSVQTLAHKENGKWVLNEIPDYLAQLTRCQRYMYVVNKTTSVDWCLLGSGMAHTSSAFTCALNTPVRMYRAPTITWSGVIQVYGHGIVRDVNRIDSSFGLGDCYVMADIGVVSSGLGVNNAYYVRLTNQNASIIFDANMY